MEKEFAPAKVNLFLDVLNKRADGYHDLGTVFQTLDMGDFLSAEKNSSGDITLSYNVSFFNIFLIDFNKKTAIFRKCRQVVKLKK